MGAFLIKKTIYKKLMILYDRQQIHKGFST